jgi:uncharacterized protein YecE (DUF72 family)
MQAASQPSFYSGTSNIVVPLKQSEYPPELKGASRLAYYASLFTSVEINATFYKLPKRATVEAWRDSVPADFRFTFKVPKTITHAPDLQFNTSEVDAFIETVAGAGDKKGCLLVQLPPKLGRDQESELEGLIESLASDAAGWRIAVEFRHPSWYDKTVYRMLQQYGAGMVKQDLPKAPTPAVEVSPDFVYLRFHGPDGSYRGSYEDTFLEVQAARIRDWLKGGKEMYVYFNNTMGNALGNLQTLNAMIGS